MKILGKHLLVELSGCPSGLLNDPAALEKYLVEAVQAGGGTILDSFFHHFQPQGVTGVVLIAESHLTIHTWPEHGYAAVDLFSCGPEFDLSAARERIEERLPARSVSTKEISRGFEPLDQD